VRSLLVLLLVAGCAFASDTRPEFYKYEKETCTQTIPGWEARQTDGKYDAALVGASMQIFVWKWVEIFGAEESVGIIESLDSLKIHWQEGHQFLRIPETEKVYYGLIYPDGTMFVSEKNALHETALVHEMVHAALWATKEDPGHKHLDGQDGIWTHEHENLIFEVNKYIEYIEVDYE